MEKKRLTIFIAVIVLIFFILGCEQKPISDEQILSLAVQQANQLGYNVQAMDIKVYRDRKQIETVKHVILNASGKPPHVKNEDYALVVFLHKNSNVKNRKLWIFIDRNKGKVIGYLKGE